MTNRALFIKLFIPIFFFLSHNLYATTVFIAEKCDLSSKKIPFEISDQTTVTEIKANLKALKYKEDSIQYCRKAHGRYTLLPLNSFNGDSSLRGTFDIKDGDLFTASLEAEKDKPAVEDIKTTRKKFLDAAWNNDIDGVVAILDTYKDAQEKLNFISHCKATDDHEKLALYLAARKGNLQLLLKIHEKVGDEKFSELLGIVDDENRTILMAAAQATDSLARPKIIKLIKQHTPANLLNAKDRNGCDAHDWALLRDHKDEPTLAALGNPGTGFSPECRFRK